MPTPLAHAIIKDSLSPKRERFFDDRSDVLAMIRAGDVRFFEVSEIIYTVDAMAGDAHAKRQDFNDARSIFLPCASGTWVEWVGENKFRSAMLLVEKEIAGQKGAIAFAVNSRRSELLGFLPFIGLQQGRTYFRPRSDEDEKLTKLLTVLAGRLPFLLAFINTPRLIGQRTHAPHRGLERNLVNAKGLTGSFPLHAWTEILLKVSLEPKQADPGVIETHLTGQKCLHWCRAHLRIRLGRLEVVSDHWRGDASIGIKRSRYRISPGGP